MVALQKNHAFWEQFLLGVEKKFRRKLTISQKKSILTVVDYWFDYYSSYDIKLLLYILANNKWETGHAWIPVKERRAIKTKQPQVWKWQERYWYTNYMGRGKTQITWVDNYKKFTPIIQLKVGDPTLDLVKNPELAMNDYISTVIMVDGMMEGLFRSKNKTPIKLTDYLDENGTFDAIRARLVVNIIDAKHVALIYQELLSIFNTLIKPLI